jgi:hypothetical protein
MNKTEDDTTEPLEARTLLDVKEYGDDLTIEVNGE